MTVTAAAAAAAWWPAAGCLGLGVCRLRRCRQQMAAAAAAAAAGAVVCLSATAAAACAAPQQTQPPLPADCRVGTMLSIRCTHQHQCDAWQPASTAQVIVTGSPQFRLHSHPNLFTQPPFPRILGTATTIVQTASPAQCVALLVAVGLPAVAELLAGKRLATQTEDLAPLVAELPAESSAELAAAAAVAAELAAELAVQLAPAPASAQLPAWLCATHGSGPAGACAAARKAPHFVSFWPRCTGYMHLRHAALRSD